MGYARIAKILYTINVINLKNNQFSLLKNINRTKIKFKKVMVKINNLQQMVKLAIQYKFQNKIST